MFDVMDMEDDARNSLLGFTEAQMAVRLAGLHIFVLQLLEFCLPFHICLH